MVLGLNTVAITPVSSKEFPDIQATIECRFTQKCVHEMLITYSQIHHTNKYSQYSSVIRKTSLAKWLSVRLRTKWLWVRTCCSHLNLDIAPALSKEFRDIQATIEYRFTQKHTHTHTHTYSYLYIYIYIYIYIYVI